LRSRGEKIQTNNGRGREKILGPASFPPRREFRSNKKPNKRDWVDDRRNGRKKRGDCAKPTSVFAGITETSAKKGRVRGHILHGLRGGHLSAGGQLVKGRPSPTHKKTWNKPIRGVQKELIQNKKGPCASRLVCNSCWVNGMNRKKKSKKGEKSGPGKRIGRTKFWGSLTRKNMEKEGLQGARRQF